MTKLNQTISTITGILVALLAAAAFWLSFDALRHLAAQNGIEAGMAWLYPAIIDGAIIIFSLSVLQTSLNKEKATYPWGFGSPVYRVKRHPQYHPRPTNLSAPCAGCHPTSGLVPLV